MAIYLDYNATAPVRPEAIDLMQGILRAPSNPSSVHGFGRAAKKYIEDARKVIADAISVWPDEIIFTASGSEANATAIHAASDRRLLISAIEHSSVLNARENTSRIPVGSNGVIDLMALENLLAEENKPALVSVMLANNETGVIQPIANIATICKKYNALLHCDAVQGLGKIEIDCGQLGADMISLAGHKSGGPVGAAALVVRRGVPYVPLIKGGGQEMRRRAGTENVAAIAGFALAVEKSADLNHMKKLRGWLDVMESEMRALRATVYGSEAKRLPNTSCISMPGVSNEVQLMDFDLKGFAVSAGSACSSGRIEPSYVLRAMNVSAQEASNVIRISGGWQTTEKEIQQFTESWKQTCVRLAKAA